jgi:perosamine synthetase
MRHMTVPRATLSCERNRLDPVPKAVIDDAIGWRAHNNDLEHCARWLAGFFGRPHGALVCSGTMALELALLHLGIRPGARIAMSVYSCPQVPAAALRSGARPVMLDPADDLVLTPRALQRLDDPPDAVIAVHEWGLPCPLAALRDALGPGVPIIEDAARAWRIHPAGTAGAEIADVVVTSMGPDKPLSIDGGGAAFARADLLPYIDTRSPGQRRRSQPALAVALSKYALPHIAAAVRQAELRTEHLRRHVPALLEELTSFGLSPWRQPGGPPPSWGLIPIRAPNPTAFRRLRYAQESACLGVCAPAPLNDIPMLAGRFEWLPRRPAQPDRWLLLDPIAALSDPRLVARWAERARP